MAEFLDERSGGLDRARDHRVQSNIVALERDLSPGNARDIEQIVDEPHHVIDLPLDDVARALVLRVRQPVNLHQLHGRPDGRERIAQLVREHRQELVLAPIRVLEP